MSCGYQETYRAQLGRTCLYRMNMKQHKMTRNDTISKKYGRILPFWASAQLHDDGTIQAEDDFWLSILGSKTMCLSDLLAALRGRGIQATASQVRWAITCGRLARPTLDGSLRFDFHEEHLTALCRWFEKQEKEDSDGK
jgi:hypothetical protein